MDVTIPRDSSGTDADAGDVACSGTENVLGRQNSMSGLVCLLFIGVACADMTYKRIAFAIHLQRQIFCCWHNDDIFVVRTTKSPLLFE